MDKYGKIVILLTLITAGLIVIGDIAYAQFRASGHQYSSSITPPQS